MERLDRGDPRAIGRYRILARIGTGGMATVYLGRSGGGRAVAVKVLRADFAHEPEFRARFRREVEAATAVGGVYSPPVLDADPDAARPWMATEFLPSVTLRDAVEQYGPLPAPSVRRLAAGLAEALAAIHRTGIVHLDVKPANVLLTADGPRLIDFGIAARARSTVPSGSRGFMSPEQMAGSAGPPSDVYSLGATLAYACGEQDAGHVATDETLRTLIADCRRPDPATRPTAAELTALLASVTPRPEATDTAWLPTPVTAAIDRQASTAANPPPPASAPPSRRSLLIGGATVLAAAGGGTAAVLAGTGSETTDEAKKSDKPRNAADPAASPSPSPQPPVKLEFVITGDGPLSTFTYWVNGRPTTLNDVPLTWRRTVEVPREPGSVEWRLRFTFPSGKVRVRVYRDGSQTTDASHPLDSVLGFPDLYPYDVDMSGASAISGPLPGADV
ncbi:serine/threonine protein kinase [Streptomyces spinoverrucosus]|uniref:serine/threonine-protein kinase n=1 Tax=Streptomyces spinoverrucosus TaxID=284043 RepID=UPI0018C3A764|nr:serine/threonine-protein kinase [Streptomyces spinoverrucosus]MBG0857641.1 serine/threonine protein kinase [Streptomyces spinoverrucosus]